MTFQALASLLVSWVLPEQAPRHEMGSDETPRWERHPAEQRALRQQDQDDAARWLRLPRGY